MQRITPMMGGALFYKGEIMTIQEIKSRLTEVHPNQYPDGMLIDWVNDVERDVCKYLKNFDDIDRDAMHTTLADEVLVDDPNVYVEYLISRICLANEEYDRYNNHAALYNVHIADWKDAYIRSHEPKYRGTYKI